MFKLEQVELEELAVEETTFSAAWDTYLDETSTEQSFETSAELKVAPRGGGTAALALVSFDLTELGTKYIVNATLQLKTCSEIVSVLAKRIDPKLNLSSSTTYAQFANGHTTGEMDQSWATGGLSKRGAEEVVSIDVTSALSLSRTTQVDEAHGDNVIIALYSAGSSACFHASESGDDDSHGPRLFVQTTTPASNAPTTLAPTTSSPTESPTSRSPTAHFEWDGTERCWADFMFIMDYPGKMITISLTEFLIENWDDSADLQIGDNCPNEVGCAPNNFGDSLTHVAVSSMSDNKCLPDQWTLDGYYSTNDGECTSVDYNGAFTFNFYNESCNCGETTTNHGEFMDSDADFSMMFGDSDSTSTATTTTDSTTAVPQSVTVYKTKCVVLEVKSKIVDGKTVIGGHCGSRYTDFEEMGMCD
jgi:hypothetical protein